MKRSNETTDSGSDSEGTDSEAEQTQKGSCSTQKGSCSGQKRAKKRKVGSTGTTKHTVGYQSKWENEFPWLLPEQNSMGAVTGMLCRYCKRHKTRNKYNKSMVWSETPCTCLRKDSVRRHSQSLQHKEAVTKELERVAVRMGVLNKLFKPRFHLTRQL